MNSENASFTDLLLHLSLSVMLVRVGFYSHRYDLHWHYQVGEFCLDFLILSERCGNDAKTYAERNIYI